MAAEVDIRRIETDELKSLIETQNEIFSDYLIPIRSSPEFFLEFLRSVGGSMSNILVATDGGKIVGYVNPVIDGGEAWIGGVGVVPTHRGRGIAKKLMVAAEDACRDKGVDEVSLEVIVGNDRAYKLYKSLGYSETIVYLTAEGRPIKFEGFQLSPKKASIADVLSLHERSYAHTCWQRRKLPAIVQSARASESYKVDGGFVVVRRIETNGFIPFLGVVPEKRRTGIGTSLAKFALSRLYDLGVFKVTVYNVNEDVQTMRMLDKFDFAVTLKQIEMKKTL